METKEFKKTLSANLIYLRKSKKLTQTEFAEQLNYSDKTISKWENGDAVPDVETLYDISKLFNISIDDLLNKNLQDTQISTDKNNARKKTNKIIITLLSTTVVWLVAIMLYVQLKIALDVDYWRIFIWAIPVFFVVLLVFNAIWGKNVFTFVIISCLVWSILVAFHLEFIYYESIWTIYFIGIPVQVAMILWSGLKK